ncbi:O-antigen polymerase [Mariniflexile sp.]|uniref:O-antigen polymerase n=2 Tax=Mariniflexile sp. TaxID=1979402 RepID=UPI004047849E
MKKKNLLFFGSVFLGPLIWFLFYMITPIEIKNSLSCYTASFISFSYIALASGFYFSSNLSHQKFIKHEISKIFLNNKYLILRLLATVILISFVFRHFDLFYYRDVKFSNSTEVNKYNAAQPQNFSVLFACLTIFRHLYFVPLVYYFANKMKSKKLLFICILLFLLPILESYLRGSRRIIFESLGLLAIILFVYGKIKLRSLKTLIVVVVIIFLSLIFSFSVVKDRGDGQENHFYTNIFNAQYNEFVPANEKVIKFIEENNNLLSHICFTEIHMGQYIIHGVFEMDYMISTKPKHTYGMYNFYSFVKVFNKLGIVDIPLEELDNPTKRITYITFFGGLFLDFGWFTIPLMFLFGVFQNKIFTMESNNYIFAPIVIILLFSNVFMLTFNFMRAQFIFSLIIYFIFIIVVYLLLNSFKKQVQ